MTPDHKCPRCGTLRPSSAVAADAAHADTIVGLGEAIEAYRATKEPRDEKAE